jgi:hypothetical protein
MVHTFASGSTDFSKAELQDVSQRDGYHETWQLEIKYARIKLLVIHSLLHWLILMTHRHQSNREQRVTYQLFQLTRKSVCLTWRWCDSVSATMFLIKPKSLELDEDISRQSNE